MLKKNLVKSLAISKATELYTVTIMRTHILFFFVLFFSCKTKDINTEKIYQKEEWVTAYKKAVAIKCMEKSGINLEKDNSGAILFEVLGSDLNILKEIDSLGNVYANEILKSPSYFEGKPIMTKVLNLYSSKKLDSLARVRYNN